MPYFPTAAATSSVQTHTTTSPASVFLNTYVRALFDFSDPSPTTLNLREGDIILVVRRTEQGWWDGVVDGVRGWFPSNYCTAYDGPVSSSVLYYAFPADQHREDVYQTDETEQGDLEAETNATAERVILDVQRDAAVADNALDGESVTLDPDSEFVILDLDGNVISPAEAAAPSSFLLI